MRVLAAIVLVSCVACVLRAEEPAPDVEVRAAALNPSNAKFNSAVSKKPPVLAPAGQALTADGTGKSLWAFVKGTAIDSTPASSSMVLTADGNGKANWQSPSAANLNGVLPIANGGTGSAAQNFVDLTTNQSIAGNKTFTGSLTGSLNGNVTGSAASFTGNVAGDVTGTQGATVISTVGGASAAVIVKAATLAVVPPGMALIPAGTYTIGNAIAADTDITDAAPVSVTVSAFYMDVNLVTYSKWRTVYIWATEQTLAYSFVNAGAGNGSNNPVVSVNWFDCVKWCNARSEQEGKTPVYYTDAAFTQVFRSGDIGTTVYANFANKGYRLPTEAEWEKAARGGLSGQRFPWGNRIDRNSANYNATAGSPDYDLGPTGITGATTPVGSFASNGYGLNDMAGNMSQLCWDWYGTPYAGGTDPHGPASGTNRVFRGGSWNFSAQSCRSAQRNSVNPADAHVPNWGFRSVLPPG